MSKIIKYLDYVIYWSIVLIPFSISIAPVPTHIFEGLLIISFLGKKVLKKEQIFTETAINIPILLLFLISCLSIFNSINYADSFKGGLFKLIRYILVFFIVVGELKDEKHIRRIIFSIAAGIALVSFDGIWQVITRRDFIRGYAPVINLGLIRATASFKDSNTLGIYLSAIAPVIFGLSLYYFKEGKKIALLLLSLLALLAIALTYSRPTLLAIYVVLLFLGIARKDKAMIALLIILTLSFPFILPTSVKKWAREVEYNPFRFMCNDDRIAAYRNSLNMIKDHPFIGLGANTYMKNYKKYREPREYRNIVTKDYMYAHNNFLHMAAEIGLIGLSIFIWLLYKLFRECQNIYKRLDNNYLKIISLSLSACLIAFLVNGLTESSLYYSRVAIIFWYICGLSLALKKFIPCK
jgi:putative inorganic carbon (HCO3(-)) transporter